MSVPRKKSTKKQAARKAAGTRHPGMTPGFGDAPKRMRDLWAWVAAVDSYDHGDASLLADLIRKEEIPPEFRSAVASMVSGHRRLKEPKGKIPPSKRMAVAATLSVLCEMTELFRLGLPKSHLEHVAEKGRQEIKGVISDLHRMKRQAQEGVADELGVHPETVKTLLRDMRKLIEKWPVV